MRQPEIGDLDMQGAGPGDQNVASREVAVHDALLVELDHGAADLLTRLFVCADAGKAKGTRQEDTSRLLQIITFSGGKLLILRSKRHGWVDGVPEVSQAATGWSS